MALESWLGKVSERQRTFTAELETSRVQSERGLKLLSQRLDAAQQRMEEREPSRVERMRESINKVRVKQRVSEKDFTSLSRREQRAVPALWQFIGVEPMRGFLEWSPHSWPRLVRQLLRDWSPDWDAQELARWAQLAGKAPSNPRWRLPLPIESVLRREGPGLLAARWMDKPLLEVVEMLRAAGLRPVSVYAGHVVAEHLRLGIKAREDCTVSLAFLMDDARGRAWLPFTGTETNVLPAPMDARVEVVAASLECRARGVCSELVRARLTERLVSKDSEFGDPRQSQSASAWARVRARAPEAFQAFLSGLIQQDLAFFFDHGMNEEDRREFWLCYLGSIRSTTCYLAAPIYDSLARRVAALPPDQQAAFRRALRLDREKYEVSAFVLSFGAYDVVEFSKNGHASYVYPRGALQQMLKGQRPETVRDLRDGPSGRFHIQRLLHVTGWQVRVTQQLLAIGIEWDKSGRNPWS
ncbi:EH signature domain-containing protein [Pyxidicoccus caerfyrddinensis]|uniref:EH signature domain-containing protein n=1 Tax=Pyxidicoccus caerfyrddinensis TaxID=2709663 RepID=UPI0013DBBFB6|nr:EH signature domain-containing protein [Pyxidicoccus caerfyrddinensis]